MSKILLAVDGDNLLHRAFYATVNVQTTENSFGHSCKAVSTFMQSLNKNLRANDYTHLAVAWDIRHTWLKRFDILKRHGIHYKNREEGLSDEQKERRVLIRKQKIVTHNLLELMGIPSLVSTKEMGIESDDILGCLARYCKVDMTDIYSNDKDMAQVLNERTRILNPTNGYIDEVNCSDFYGVDPDKIIDLMCLLGDDVDNIPGVSGCGPKTAIKLLDQYGSLDNIIANRHSIKGAAGKTLKEEKHLPFDVLRSVLELDTKAYPKKHEIFSLKPMSLKTIQDNIESNFSTIKRFKESMNYDGYLLKDMGI